MLETNGIEPRLVNRECEEILCQQYYEGDQLQQEVDVLNIKVNGDWHQLYFDSGIVFWRQKVEEPTPFVAEPGDLMSYPFVDVAEKYNLKQAVISDCVTEPLAKGARITLQFEDRGNLMITHINNKTSLRFIES